VRTEQNQVDVGIFGVPADLTANAKAVDFRHQPIKSASRGPSLREKPSSAARRLRPQSLHIRVLQCFLKQTPRQGNHRRNENFHLLIIPRRHRSKAACRSPHVPPWSTVCTRGVDVAAARCRDRLAPHGARSQGFVCSRLSPIVPARPRCEFSESAGSPARIS